MKTLTNKLVTSVLALVLTGAALSIGVFAWFTINNQATIESFNGTVETGEGFYVSLDGATWKNTFTSAEMQTHAGDVTFQALTSADGVSLNDLDGVTQAGGFIEFELFFVGSNNLTHVSLTELLMSATQTSWIPGVYVPGTRQAANDDSTPIIEYVSNAARVSFEDLFDPGTATVFQQAEGATTDTLNTGTDGNSLGKGDFETNEALLFYNAIMPTADQLTETDFTSASLPTTLEAGQNLNNNVAQLVPNTVSDPADVTITPTQSVIDVLGEDYVKGAVTVRVWVEGWDQEAFNAILSGVLSTSFRFAGVTTPETP